MAFMRCLMPRDAIYARRARHLLRVLFSTHETYAKLPTRLFAGIYILYSTYSDHSAKSGLHRSNAVHRGRARPSLPAIDSSHPNEDNPLGSVFIRSHPYDVTWGILTQGQPHASELLAELGLSADQERALQVSNLWVSKYLLI